MDKYLWILLAALLLASCSAIDSEEQAGGSAVASAVSFDVTTDDAATRSVIANTSEFAIDGRKFRVWAFMQKNNTGDWTPMTSDYNSNKLEAVDVTYIANRREWTTTETYYWPRPKFTVDFYAVYPSADIFDADNKKLVYTVPADNNSVDVMYATCRGKRDGTEAARQRKPVDLKFHHALSQISFYGKLHSDLVALGWKVIISNITICNIKSQGSLQLITDADYANHPKKYTNQSLPVNYSLAMNTPQTLTTASVAKDSEDKEIPLTSPTDVAMLIPQELTAWDNTAAAQKMGTTAPSTSNSYLAVTLRIMDSNNVDIFGPDPITVFSPFDCGVAGGWQAGVYYQYTLKISGGYNAKGNPIVNPIEFSAAIQPWISDAATNATSATPGTATHTPAVN